MDESLIRAQLGRLTNSDHQVEVFETLPSTNRRLVENCKEIPPGVASVCVAGRQTAGVGRRGRQWHSGDSSITFSILSQLPLPMASLGGLSLVTGLVIADVVESFCKSDVSVKWPNDVLVDSRKLAGILIEVPLSVGSMSTVVTGIGVNYSIESEHQSVDQPLISLSEIAALKSPAASTEQLSLRADHGVLPGSSGRIPEREIVIAQIAAAVLNAYQQFSELGWQPFAQRYAERNFLLGKSVDVHHMDRVENARVLGIDSMGGLLVEIGGISQSLFSGEVSVRVHK